MKNTFNSWYKFESLMLNIIISIIFAVISAGVKNLKYIWKPIFRASFLKQIQKYSRNFE